MIALTDQQLEIVMAAATPLPPEKRALLLERLAAHLQLYGRRGGRGFGDVDVGLALSAALRGLVQSAVSPDRPSADGMLPSLVRSDTVV
jgi:hypothetical protein